MTFKIWCKKSWWFILCIIGFIVEPFICWLIGQYYIAISSGLISWLSAIILTIVFFMSWYDIKKVYNKCQHDIEITKEENANIAKTK